MKSIVCTKPGELKYDTASLPELQPGHAIIKIKRIGICGTDLHAFEGTQPFFNYPRVLGHELSGELVDYDGAGNFRIGQPVTFIPYFNCGHCIACRTGKPNCCVQMKVCGVHVDGGMVEYLSVPSASLLDGTGLSYDELALIEPLAIGAHGIRRSAAVTGEFVLVIGAGPIGIATMEFAVLAGASVIAMDVNEQRLNFCKKHFSGIQTVHALAPGALDQVKQLTSSDMPAVVIDATGNLQAINHAFQYMAHGGRYVLVGLQKADISFSHPEFHKREGTLMSSRNALWIDFEHVMNSVRNGNIQPGGYITHRAAFDDTVTQFHQWLDPANAVIKAMVSME